MAQRSREQLHRDRADLLAMLEEGDAPVRLDRLAMVVHGVDATSRTPNWQWTQALKHTATDLRAFLKAGKVVGRTSWGQTMYASQYADSVWELAAPGTLSSAEKDADEDDVRRLRASWEEVPEVPC